MASSLIKISFKAYRLDFLDASSTKKEAIWQLERKELAWQIFAQYGRISGVARYTFYLVLFTEINEIHFHSVLESCLSYHTPKTSHNWICLYPKQNLELNSSVLIFNFFPKVRLYVLLLYKVTIITLINWSDSCCRTDDWQFDKDPNQDWKFAINVVSVCCLVHTVQFNLS